jgi:uncharacterized damage-inducible protein DinB
MDPLIVLVQYKARSEMLLHAVNHGTYHRGNVAALLYQIGRTPPTTDLPVYLREIRTGRAA